MNIEKETKPSNPTDSIRTVQTDIIQTANTFEELVEQCKQAIVLTKFNVGKELRRWEWTIGDLVYRNFGKLKQWQRTQEEIADELNKFLDPHGNKRHPVITQQRISEYVRFRKDVGEDFEEWCRGRESIRNFSYRCVKTLIYNPDIEFDYQENAEKLQKERDRKEAILKKEVEAKIGATKEFETNDALERLEQMLLEMLDPTPNITTSLKAK